MKHFLLTVLLLSALVFAGTAQNKLSIDKVYSAQLRNSGAIREGELIKGYYLFYMSDKIDKSTNEYTLQILDQNLNKVKDIKFTDSKKVRLLEASYNGEALAFFFRNDETESLDLKVYSMEGKLKATYSKPIDKKMDAYLSTYGLKKDTDENLNKNIYDLNGIGFASVVPVKEGKHYSYEVDVYFSATKRQWTYAPTGDEERYANANYLGHTDSLILLEVTKKARMLTGKVSANLIGINFYTRKKVFEITPDVTKETFIPINLTTDQQTGNMILVGSYYEKGANIIKDFSKGIAVCIYDHSGKLLSETHNSWTEDMSKFLNVSAKGKVEDVGYIYFHDIIQTNDGKIFAIGEGYKRSADALGIGLNVLMAAGGGISSGGNTKMKTTDMVLVEFNPQYKVTNATVYGKSSNSFHTVYADLNSQHMMAMLMKNMGAFDYAFTTSANDKSSFSFCYNDYERSKEYKGQVFNSIKYNGKKLTTDKITLTSTATSMEVLPGKPGSVMIMEYFKKDKKLDLRLEKLN